MSYNVWEKKRASMYSKYKRLKHCRIWHLTPYFRPSTGWDSYRFNTQGSGQSCNKYDIIPTHFLRMAEMTPKVTPMDTGHSKGCYSCSTHIVLYWSWKILLLKNWNIADSVSLQLRPDISFILRVKLLPVKCLLLKSNYLTRSRDESKGTV